MSNKAIGLQDIAERLNLSISTVSRGIRDADGIHPATRAKIMQEAEALGYVGHRDKNERAKVDESRKRNILILTGGKVTPGGYLEGLSQTASNLGVSLHIHHCPQERCSELFSGNSEPVSLREGICDGVILIYRWPTEVIKTLVQRVPVVSIMHDYPGMPMDIIGIDTVGGVNSLVSHLKDLGHQRMGFFGLMPEVAWSRARFGAFVESATYAGVPVEMNQVIRFEEDVLRHGEAFRTPAAINQVIRGIKSGVRAWLAADDYSGYCLCEELSKQGLQVPKDVSITGFHYHDFMQNPHLPALTSTLVDNVEIGRLALKLLLQRMESAGKPLRLYVPAEFKAGESTGK